MAHDYPRYYLPLHLGFTYKDRPWKGNISLIVVYFPFTAHAFLKLHQTHLWIEQSVLLLQWIYCFPPLDSCYVFLNMHHFNNPYC